MWLLAENRLFIGFTDSFTRQLNLYLKGTSSILEASYNLRIVPLIVIEAPLVSNVVEYLSSTQNDMRAFIATVLLLLTAISPSTADDIDDCAKKVGTSCKGEEGDILCCEGEGFVYCQCNESIYVGAQCLSKKPSCVRNTDGFQSCENGAGQGIDVTRVSNTGDVIGLHGEVLWNVITLKGIDSDP